MAKVKNTLDYTCNDDCSITGCGGHKADIEFNSISCTYEIHVGEDCYFFNDAQIQAIVSLIKSIDYRKDTVKF